jgi:hypothetical protein
MRVGEIVEGRDVDVVMDLMVWGFGLGSEIRNTAGS